MKKIIAKIAIAAPAFLFFAVSGLKAQNSFDLNAINADEISAAIAADRSDAADSEKQIAPSRADSRKEWTIMVFMNSKNNLSQSAAFGLAGKWAEKDIAEMKKVGTTEKVNVVVEFGTTGKGSKRMLVGKGGLFSSGEKIYSQDPKADMGDYKRVIDFVKWSKQTFPSRKYMLILWNHGLGWIDPVMEIPGAGTAAADKGILFDDETKNYVRTGELGEILRQGGYVDVFAMNACLMQMAEVAYEVKDNTGLIIASEETMLAYGFDYEKLLNFMNANTAADNVQISDFFINWERDFYAEGASVGFAHMPLNTITATISTLRPAALNDLPAYLDAFAGAAMRNNETEAVKTAIAGAIRFASLDPKNDKKKMIAPYADLYDFAGITGTNAKNQETRKAAESLRAFIKNKLVIRSLGLNSDTENGYDYGKVGGIAINMTMKIKPVPPQLAAVSQTKYGDLALSRASQWDEFVTWTDGVWSK